MPIAANGADDVINHGEICLHFAWALTARGLNQNMCREPPCFHVHIPVNVSANNDPISRSDPFDEADPYLCIA